MFNLSALAPLRPVAAPPVEDDRPDPRWMVESIREAYALLSAALDPSPRDVEAARRILEQALRDSL